jgi:hypothetical protein
MIKINTNKQSAMYSFILSGSTRNLDSNEIEYYFEKDQHELVKLFDDYEDMNLELELAMNTANEENLYLGSESGVYTTLRYITKEIREMIKYMRFNDTFHNRVESSEKGLQERKEELIDNIITDLKEGDVTLANNLVNKSTFSETVMKRCRSLKIQKSYKDIAEMISNRLDIHTLVYDVLYDKKAS